ncbi:MAG: HupE/UreJ family protein [Arachidicoccus sp.]|nr:HupE/UreJ family protein [Arachidicoccus sp.]
MKYVLFFIGLVLLIPFSSQAHVVVNELSQLSTSSVAWEYLKLGYRHILPLGFDHILFILSLLLLSPQLKPLLIQANTFTIAHSITLGLSMFGLINPISTIVEPLISISILLVALENIFSNKLKPSRLIVVFVFGLIHGMGFASALQGLGLPKNSYLLGIVMFNIGVELGQVTIILVAYFILIKWLSKKVDYKKVIVIPISTVIALVAIFWTIQRIF